VLISTDGRWWWDGTRWRSRLVEGELDRFWFTSTPDWVARIAVTGLIALIPIAGTMNFYGWTLVATDMVRQGWRELPPAGFHYIERGVAPFLITFFYGLAFLLVLATLITAGFVFLFSQPSQTALAIAAWLLAVLVLFGWWLISLYMFASVLIGSDRLGAGRAFNPARLFALASRNFNVSLHVAVTYGLASLVLGLATAVVGSIVPFGGVAVAVVVPAILAMLVPLLATFRVDDEKALPLRNS
jgi:hypothetical protein